MTRLEKAITAWSKGKKYPARCDDYRFDDMTIMRNWAYVIALRCWDANGQPVIVLPNKESSLAIIDDNLMARRYLRVEDFLDFNRHYHTICSKPRDPDSLSALKSLAHSISYVQRQGGKYGVRFFRLPNGRDKDLKAAAFRLYRNSVAFTVKNEKVKAFENYDDAILEKMRTDCELYDLA